MKSSLHWHSLPAARLAWMTHDAPARWRWVFIEPHTRLRAPNGREFLLRMKHGIQIARVTTSPE